MTEVNGIWPDEWDDAIIAQLREVHALVDAPPDDLADRALFALAVAGLGAEVARMQGEQLVGSGARGTERTRTVNFEADSLTILVTVSDALPGRVRIDGWLAPPGRHRVELRMLGAAPGAAVASRSVTADDAGRFAFPAIRHGLGQFVVHLGPDGAGQESTVVTPSVSL